MYRKDSGRWVKHTDFIALDILSLQAALILAYAFSGYGIRMYHSELYRNVAAFMAVTDLVVLLCTYTMSGVLKRGYYKEFIITVKHALWVEGFSLLYLFLIQKGQSYSRLTMILASVLYIILAFFTRQIWKCHLLKKKTATSDDKRILIVTTRERAGKAVKTMVGINYGRYTIAGIALVGYDCSYNTDELISGVPIVAGGDEIPEYVCQGWVDEIMLIADPDEVPFYEDLLNRLMETGVTIHQNLVKVKSAPGKQQFVEKIGPYTVLTTSINSASTLELMLKRLVDIAGGLCGCILTGIIFIFVAPAIYIASPGPIFFSQERVGKNGKHFKMYKFRSMYLDAEARKAELMKENKLGDGKMFKMDFDPRVIGNRILADGTRKTGVGDFLRRTSLDEFPQFYNVLKGDMSIVGTRPPLISETELYELRHKARLAIKPGITGMWQVSGRSDITDFEEVVRLDREYIENWNLGLDIQILFKTVLVVLKKRGAE